MERLRVGNGTSVPPGLGWSRAWRGRTVTTGVGHQSASVGRPPRRRKHQMRRKKPVQMHRARQRSSRLRQRRLAGAVDQDEQHAARPPRAIRPRMVGAALHHHAARLQRHFGIVEHQRDLALDHHAVVHGPGAVHQRMRRAGLAGRGLGVADVGERLACLRGHRLQRGRRLGREVDEAHPRAVLRWRQDQRPQRRVGGSRPTGAGAPAVLQISWNTVPGTAAISMTVGSGPSCATIALPAASWPVTTRWTGGNGSWLACGSPLSAWGTG
jgi:hypothetical protein